MSFKRYLNSVGITGDQFKKYAEWEQDLLLDDYIGSYTPMYDTKFFMQPFPAIVCRITNENMVQLARWCDGRIIDHISRGLVEEHILFKGDGGRLVFAPAGRWLVHDLRKDNFEAYTDDQMRDIYTRVNTRVAPGFTPEERAEIREAMGY